MDTDDSYSFTFTAAGDYRYFCSLHPHMTGIIKVE
jgi:plastocyanin